MVIPQSVTPEIAFTLDANVDGYRRKAIWSVFPVLFVLKVLICELVFVVLFVRCKPQVAEFTPMNLVCVEIERLF